MEGGDADGRMGAHVESFGPIKTLLGVLPPDRAESFRTEMLEYLEDETTDEGIDIERLYRLIVGHAEA